MKDVMLIVDGIDLRQGFVPYSINTHFRAHAVNPVSNVSDPISKTCKVLFRSRFLFRIKVRITIVIETLFGKPRRECNEPIHDQHPKAPLSRILARKVRKPERPARHFLPTTDAPATTQFSAPPGHGFDGETGVRCGQFERPVEQIAAAAQNDPARRSWRKRPQSQDRLRKVVFGADIYGRGNCHCSTRQRVRE